jgi:NADH dehydrogenase
LWWEWGFGGLRVASNLANTDLEVLAIDRRNFHLFQPLLYQVATAMLEQENIAYNTRSMVREWPNVNFQMSDVRGIDLDKKCVATSDGNLPYDYLVIATGSVTNFFGNEQLRQNAFDLKQLDDAVNLRNHILGVYELAAKEKDPVKRQALMTFVIVGGGPTGVEFSGALAELTHTILTKDYPFLDVKKAALFWWKAAAKS